MPDRNGTTPTSGSTPTSSPAQAEQTTCADRITDQYVADRADHLLRQLGHPTAGGQQ